MANFGHPVELRLQFVKVDISLVRGVSADLCRQVLTVAYSTLQARPIVRVSPGGIETEAERAALETLEIQLGQR